jgi:hypothetical protein
VQRPHRLAGECDDSRLVCSAVRSHGFTASGIIANLYRIAVKKRSETTLARLTYLTVMIVAGPTVLFNNAAKSWHEKSCSASAFWLAAGIAGYWSFAIGLLLVQLALAL